MITIKEQLTADEQMTLERLYPEFNFDFRLCLNKTHPMASAVRVVEHHLIMRRLHYSRAAVENNYGYDSLICDIGGDVAYHVLENNVGVHCDCPALDQRDSVRFYSKISRLRSFIVEHDNDPFVSSKDKAVIDMCRVVVRAANDKCVDTDVFCRKKAQDCMRTARFGMLTPIMILV
ncbi:hypothetical protein OSTOST_02774 [Ostertagia ostertagi]